MSARIVSILAFLSTLSLLPALCFGQVADVSVIAGQCNSDSHIAEGKLGEDLTKRQSRFFCDSVSIGYFDNVGKHVMLNFSESKSQTSSAIGYAGFMEPDGLTMNVDRVYLAGKQFQVTEGACRFFYFPNKQVKDIVCGAPIDQGDRRTVPVVSFSASSNAAPKSVNSTIPSYIAATRNSEGEEIFLTSKVCKSPSGVVLDQLKTAFKFIGNNQVDQGCYAIAGATVTAMWYGSKSQATYDKSQFAFNK